MDKPKATSTRQLKEGGRIKKQCLKSRPVCKVTFKLPKEASSGAQQVCVVGDFNNWSKEAHLMNRLKNGTFTLTLELEKGRDYRFRYLIDGHMWENDWCADNYVPNRYGCDDSVVMV
jgi:1,4-alpha-glucan branching enzyme